MGFTNCSLGFGVIKIIHVTLVDLRAIINFRESRKVHVRESVLFELIFFVFIHSFNFYVLQIDADR